MAAGRGLWQCCAWHLSAARACGGFFGGGRYWLLWSLASTRCSGKRCKFRGPSPSSHPASGHFTAPGQGCLSPEAGWPHVPCGFPHRAVVRTKEGNRWEGACEPKRPICVRGGLWAGLQPLLGSRSPPPEFEKPLVCSGTLPCWLFPLAPTPVQDLEALT